MELTGELVRVLLGVGPIEPTSLKCTSVVLKLHRALTCPLMRLYKLIDNSHPFLFWMIFSESVNNTTPTFSWVFKSYAGGLMSCSISRKYIQSCSTNLASGKTLVADGLSSNFLPFL